MKLIFNLTILTAVVIRKMQENLVKMKHTRKLQQNIFLGGAHMRAASKSCNVHVVVRLLFIDVHRVETSYYRSVNSYLKLGGQVVFAAPFTSLLRQITWEFRNKLSSFNL